MDVIKRKIIVCYIFGNMKHKLKLIFIYGNHNEFKLYRIIIGFPIE